MLVDVKNAKIFAMIVSSMCPIDIREMFDMGVYRNNGSFRTLVTPKLDDDLSRFKLFQLSKESARCMNLGQDDDYDRKNDATEMEIYFDDKDASFDESGQERIPDQFAPRDKVSRFVNWTDDLTGSFITYNLDNKFNKLRVVSICKSDIDENGRLKSIKPDDGREYSTLEMDMALAVHQTMVDNFDCAFTLSQLSVNRIEFNIDKNCYFINLVRIKNGTLIYCDICKRKHSNENLSYIINVISGDIISINVLCFRANKVQFLALYSIKTKSIITETNQDEVEICLNNTDVSVFSDADILKLKELFKILVNKWVSVVKYYSQAQSNTPSLNICGIDVADLSDENDGFDFTTVSTKYIYVASETGTGKSKVIAKWAQLNMDKSCVILVPLRTLAIAYYEVLGDYGFVTNAVATGGILTKNSRVISVFNSILRVKDLDYDMLVLDEVLSIYNQVSSTNSDAVMCCRKLDEITNKAHKVISLDAHFNFVAIRPLIEKSFRYPMELLKQTHIAVNGKRELLNNMSRKVIESMKHGRIRHGETMSIRPAKYVVDKNRNGNAAIERNNEAILKTIVVDNNHTVILNRFKRGVGQLWEMISDETVFLLKLLQHARDNKRMVVCCTCKSTVKALELYLTTFSSRTVNTVIGDTPRDTKISRIYGLDTIVSERIILISNTAITVGISTITDIDSVFTMNGNNLINDFVQYQQTQRCRKAKNFYVLLSKKAPMFRPITLESFMIRFNLYMSNTALHSNLPCYNVAADKLASCYGSTAWYFIVTAKLLTNLSIMSPNKLFITLILSTGAHLIKNREEPSDYMSNEEFDAPVTVLRIKRLCKIREHQDMVKCDIPVSSLDELKSLLIKYVVKLRANKTEEDFWFLKYTTAMLVLRKRYKYLGLVDIRFIRRYNTRACYERYKNMCDMAPYANHDGYKDFVSSKELMDSKDLDLVKIIRNYCENKPKMRIVENMHNILVSLGVLNPCICRGEIVDINNDTITNIISRSLDILPPSIRRTYIYDQQLICCRRFLGPFGFKLSKIKDHPPNLVRFDMVKDFTLIRPPLGQFDPEEEEEYDENKPIIEYNYCHEA